MNTDDIVFYHNGLPGLSASDIKLLYRSPAHWFEYKQHPPEATPSMILGSAVHMAILEPVKFIEKYTAIDDDWICTKIGGAKPRATNAYKEWKAEFIEDNPGKIILDLDDFNKAVSIARAVHTHPIAGALLKEPGSAEKPLQWVHHGTGVQLKARPDYLTDSGKIIDVKTCTDARPDAFSRQIFQMLYFIQMGVYWRGVDEVLGLDADVVFIAVETETPYAVAVYSLEPEIVKLGAQEADRLIALYKRCYDKNDFPAYPEVMQPISLPPWAISQVVIG